jgi:hypothetical protein
MKNLFLSIFISIASLFCVINVCAQERTIDLPALILSEAEATELEALIHRDYHLGELDPSENHKLHILSQIRAKNSGAYKAREEKRKELALAYDELQKYQGLCAQPTQLLKHVIHNDYDALGQELWDTIYNCHMARKSFNEYQRVSWQEKKLHDEVLLTPVYKAMQEGKLIIDLPKSEQK